MRQRIYLDTSVIGGYIDKEFQVWSRQLFDEFKTGKKIALEIRNPREILNIK